jgi:hypothetical protein
MGDAHTAVSNERDGDNEGAVDGPKALGEVKLAKTIIRMWLFHCFVHD